nr:uncharacterized protein LOC124819046 [Hydra vulgaris]
MEMFMKFKIETEEMLKQQENTFTNTVSSNTKILNDRSDRVKFNILQNSTKIASIAKEVEEIKIERAHRIGKVVLKLLDFKDNTEILNNSSKLKGKNIFVYEDYCKETNVIRKTLREKMKIERQAGKCAYISYDKLIVRDWNSKKK